MTGSNADNRIMVRPSEMGAAIAYLANKIVGGVSAPALNSDAKAALDKIATELKAARGKSVRADIGKCY
jgi:molybdopterin-containing oxidoreductase family iron-sulfur binding subunit